MAYRSSEHETTGNDSNYLMLGRSYNALRYSVCNAKKYCYYSKEQLGVGDKRENGRGTFGSKRKYQREYVETKEIS